MKEGAANKYDYKNTSIGGFMHMLPRSGYNILNMKGKIKSAATAFGIIIDSDFLNE